MPDGGGSAMSLAWLDRPLPPRRDGDPDARVAQMRSLSNKGEYEQAARVAEALLADGAGDAMVLSRYLFGVFLAKGFPALPRMLDALGRAIDASIAGGDRRAIADADAALGWLCRTARDRVDFHQTVKDATWKSWIGAADLALCDAIGEACARLMKAIGEAVPASTSLEHVAAIAAFVRGTLRGLVPRPPPPPPPEPPPPPIAAPEDPPAEAAAREPEPVVEKPPRRAALDRAPQPALPEDEAPAMLLLRQKLAGFQELVDRGDFARAAIVARDIERVIERFDPRVYFPRLFAPFYRRLAISGEDLAPHWEGEGSLAWRALEQLYQVDLEAFLDDDEAR